MGVLGNTGALGKDLFDFGRPYAHTKVHFGDEQYNPAPMWTRRRPTCDI